MTPRQIDEFRPRELTLYLQGRDAAELRELRRIAWHACQLWNAVGALVGTRKQVTLADLLPDKPAPRQITDPDEMKQYLAERALYQRKAASGRTQRR